MGGLDHHEMPDHGAKPSVGGVLCDPAKRRDQHAGISGTWGFSRHLCPTEPKNGGPDSLATSMRFEQGLPTHSFRDCLPNRKNTESHLWNSSGPLLRPLGEARTPALEFPGCNSIRCPWSVYASKLKIFFGNHDGMARMTRRTADPEDKEPASSFADGGTARGPARSPEAGIDWVMRARAFLQIRCVKRIIDYLFPPKLIILFTIESHVQALLGLFKNHFQKVGNYAWPVLCHVFRQG